MAGDLIYPENAELIEIAQEKMPRLQADRPIFASDLMPIETQDAARLIWEQMDSFAGLQGIRGINGNPGMVRAVGLNRYEADPGFYGESMEIDEVELMTRRTPGTFGQPIKIDDLVLQRQDHLLLRQLDRQEQICWAVLTTGTYSVAKGGSVLATDSFTLQDFTPVVPWSTVATATPFQDFKTVKLKHRGYSVSFGADAKAYMNAKTYNVLSLNTNSADIYGRRTAGLGTINSLPQINALLQNDDLPQIIVYDQGYRTVAEDNYTWTFTPFIPDGVVVVVGKRPAGQRVGAYRMVRNVNNPSFTPGSYTYVTDSLTSNNPVPRKITVHTGHNGAPVIFYPSAIVKMNVYTP